MGESATHMDWWRDLDDEIVRSVDARGILSAAELAQTLLALDGKVRIRVVEAVRGGDRG